MGVNLKWTMSADNSGLRRAFSWIKTEASKVGADVQTKTVKDLRKQLISSLTPMRLLGTGAALAGGAAYAAQNVLSSGKDIATEAAKAGLSPTDYQAAKQAVERLGDASDVTASEFVSLVDSIKKTNTVISDEMIQKQRDVFDRWKAFLLSLINPLKEPVAELADVFLRFSQSLAVLDKTILAIIQLRNPIEAFKNAVKDYREMNAAPFGKKTMSGASGTWGDGEPDKARLDALRKYQMGGQSEDRTVRSSNADRYANVPDFKPVSDALTRIGLFVGGAPLGMLGLQKAQLRELQNIRNESRGIKDAIKDL